jgi:hypothetical protein
MTTPWYIALVSWPSKSNDSLVPTTTPLRLVTQFTPEHVLSGSRMAGIIYHFQCSDPSLLTADLVQKIKTHFWSYISQSIFYHVPIAIVTPSTHPWSELLAKILTLERLVSTKTTYCETVEQAVNWLQTEHAALVNDSSQWPPIVYSSIN